MAVVAFGSINGIDRTRMIVAAARHEAALEHAKQLAEDEAAAAAQLKKYPDHHQK